jgi:hypothetical protein
MKHFPRMFGAGVCAVLLSMFAVRAESPEAPANGVNPVAVAPEVTGGENLMMVLEVYAIGKDDFRALLESDLGGVERYQRVLELERGGKARLETLTGLPTKSGQRAVVEANDEVRYPTEFAPGKTREDFPTPTAFETRNVGDSLEIEPATGPDGLTCDVNLVPQRVSLAGFRDLTGMSDDPPVGQPLFVMQKLTTSATVQFDQVRLIGTYSPPAVDANRQSSPEIWLAFLHLHRVLAGAEAKDVKFRTGSTIDLEYSFYSLDRDAARDLLASFPKLETSWERLQGLLRENKARFEDFISVKTKSGQRCVAEGVHETRYGAEYALPGVRRTHETKTESSVKDDKKQAQNAQNTQNSSATNTVTTTVDSATPTSDPTPGAFTAFETRNTGLFVEVEPAVGPDDATVDLNHVVSSVRDLGSLDTTGAAAHVPAQPVFESRKITTSITSIIGSHALVGTLSKPGADGVNGRVDDGRTWLVFLRVMPGDR